MAPRDDGRLKTVGGKCPYTTPTQTLFIDEIYVRINA
jgi:hypothetical protein